MTETSRAPQTAAPDLAAGVPAPAVPSPGAAPLDQRAIDAEIAAIRPDGSPHPPRAYPPYRS
ncbi:hypothetical protein G5C65_33920, partial [Streptomyces sp. SB3404]|nr:hypothetical protein [Streptomyces boncukensis]